MRHARHRSRRLGVEVIDLLQIHLYDENTPVEETMEALGRLVQEGKVRHLGACNLRAWQLAKMNFTARANGWPEFEAVQVHYNLLYREEERDLLPFCIDQGIAVLPWSPLAARSAGTSARSLVHVPGQGRTMSRTRCTASLATGCWTCWPKYRTTTVSSPPASLWPGCGPARA